MKENTKWKITFQVWYVPQETRQKTDRHKTTEGTMKAKDKTITVLL